MGTMEGTVREKLWALVDRRVSGNCQPLWAKGTDTDGWIALTLATVGAETPNTHGPSKCCNYQALPFCSLPLEAKVYNSCQVARAQISKPPTCLPKSHKFLKTGAIGVQLSRFLS